MAKREIVEVKREKAMRSVRALLCGVRGEGGGAGWGRRGGVRTGKTVERLLVWSGWTARPAGLVR